LRREGQMVYQDLKTYDGHTQIQTPHNPEAITEEMPRRVGRRQGASD
jgi:hypothetical protein